MKPRLLLYLASGDDRGRYAVGPTLAAAAVRAGWRFDCYYDRHRLGRHYGGGDPAAAPPGTAAGGLVAGGRHLERVAMLAAAYDVVAVGDRDSVLWPALESAGTQPPVGCQDKASAYREIFKRLGLPFPTTVLVVDGTAQGRHGVITAPYAFPAFLGGDPVVGLEAGDDAGACELLEAAGVERYRGVWVDPATAVAFPRPLPPPADTVANRSDAAVTAAIAAEHARWGRGVLLGDPDLVAAQLPKAVRLRLLPLYGRPQTDVIERCRDLIAAAAEPVYGRQFDDRDFIELGRLGHGLQVVDPAPPFDSAVRSPAAASAAVPPRSTITEPDEDQLRAWADEGRVLTTLLFWTGMVRELDCVPTLVDLAAATGLRAGLIVTEATVAHGVEPALSLLSSPPSRGGVLGQLELLVGSTGRGVGAEGLLPPGALAAHLLTARRSIAAHLPAALEPRGWWPLLDTSLVAHRPGRVHRRGLRPVLRFTPRGGLDATAGGPPPPGDGARERTVDLRAVAGAALRASGAIKLFEPHRPFDDRRPGPFDHAVLRAVADAGFGYQWTKAAFGSPAVVARAGDVVALPFTAGSWDGWSPFYTVGGAGDLLRAEARLVSRRRPGWLVSTVDTPLWAMSGELIRHGQRLHELAALVTAGGRSGRLVNTTPHVIARYARLLDDQGRLAPPAGSR